MVIDVKIFNTNKENLAALWIHCDQLGFILEMQGRCNI